MLKIPSGKFTMGGDDPANKAVEVTLTQPTWLANREVTVEQFNEFATDAKYFDQHPAERVVGFAGHDKNISKTPDSPVQQVSWHDAASFCNWLSGRNGLTPCYEVRLQNTVRAKSGGQEDRGPQWVVNVKANGYRLPSEAQWEYACRAGANTEYCYGNGESRLSSYAVYSASATLPAGSKLPNAWGLFDMHGNVFEWCQEDPVVTQDPLEASSRVHRGGCWSNIGQSCRSAGRYWSSPVSRDDSLGFRVALVQSSK